MFLKKNPNYKGHTPKDQGIPINIVLLPLPPFIFSVSISG